MRIATVQIVLVLILPLAITHKADGSVLRQIEVVTRSALNPRVVFDYRIPEPVAAPTTAALKVLILVPGFNGSGKPWLESGGDWSGFADANNLVLLSPNFRTDPSEIHSRRGYYYPDQWSGKATLDALAQLQSREKVDTSRILLFGFSAGAHFAHRFALWRPDKVKAFVAYSAGWWDRPTAALANTPALILCGEADERYAATRAFLDEGLRLRLPWLWRSYKNTGHEITPAVQKMAQTFLGYEAAPVKRGVKWTGDIQTFACYPSGTPEAQAIPTGLRVELPSREVADAWKKE